MSTKRGATSELNHENWDQDDPSEHEDMGTFKTAPKEVLEKRVIRTAKRRSHATGEEGKKAVFSGFGGFNKSQPSSFDFLANLTNGNKALPASKSDTTVTSSLFSNKPFSPNNSNTAIFGSSTEGTSAPNTKATFGFSTQPSSLFGASLTSAQTSTSIFTASKADSTVGSPLKTQPISSADTTTTNTDSTKTTSVTGSKMSSTLFGVSSSNTNTGKSLFSTTNTSTPIKPMLSSGTSLNNIESPPAVSKSNFQETSKGSAKDEKELIYFSKLKGLNESVSDWIKKHVEETPLCILSPIFKDYEKYLNEMQDECYGNNTESKIKKPELDKTCMKSDIDKSSKGFSGFSSNATPASKLDTPKLSGYGTLQSMPVDKPTFSFGIKSNDTSNAPTKTGFTFGISSTPSSTKTTNLFSTTSTVNSNGSTPFSLGTSPPFSFNSKIQNPDTEGNNATNAEDEPPKVEYTPVVEENSVYDTKCKIFVKKDGNFVDKGVATLYIKKVEESGKNQLLVRANTNLGTILLNLILSSAIPTQRMGKNNVMMVCIPTPDSKPPPTPILIRVKTSEEADDLLATLDKYKT